MPQDGFISFSEFMGMLRPFGVSNLGEGRVADDDFTLVVLQQHVDGRCVAEVPLFASEDGDFKIPIEEAARVRERFERTWKKEQHARAESAGDDSGRVPRDPEQGD